jgi:hypothetical protein
VERTFTNEYAGPPLFSCMQPSYCPALQAPPQSFKSRRITRVCLSPLYQAECNLWQFFISSRIHCVLLCCIYQAEYNLSQSFISAGIRCFRTSCKPQASTYECQLFEQVTKQGKPEGKGDQKAVMLCQSRYCGTLQAFLRLDVEAFDLLRPFRFVIYHTNTKKCCVESL